MYNDSIELLVLTEWRRTKVNKWSSLKYHFQNRVLVGTKKALPKLLPH